MGGTQLSELVEGGLEKEFIEMTTSYSLDFAVPSLRLAIELDGPSHFLLPAGRGALQAPHGSTLLKRRLLAMADWCVVSIPYFEWNALDSMEAQRLYLECNLPSLFERKDLRV